MWMSRITTRLNWFWVKRWPNSSMLIKLKYSHLAGNSLQWFMIHDVHVEMIKSYLFPFVTLNRTDAGVHATNTTCHIDVNCNLPPWVITKRLNATFQAWNEQIRILKTIPVSNEFDSRREAMCRSYLYRFAVCKKPVPKGMNPKIYHSSMFIPIEESFRCYFLLWVQCTQYILFPLNFFVQTIHFIQFHPFECALNVETKDLTLNELKMPLNRWKEFMIFDHLWKFQKNKNR